MRQRLGKAWGTLLSAGVVAGGIVTTATPAVAITDGTLRPTAWAMIDSLAANQTIVTGDARVGAWRDDEGKHHLAKSYFTFDLTGYRGREVRTAGFVAPQLSAADCDREFAVELWRTEPAQAPTWTDQPAELAQLASPNQIGCPTGEIGWDVSDTIATAAADGQESITFGLRVSEEYQGDTAYGRTFDSAPYLRLTYNTAPNSPTDLAVGNRYCTADRVFVAPEFDGLSVRGQASDPDGDHGLTAHIEVWDTTNPTDVYAVDPGVYGGSFSALFPSSRIVEGNTYQWRARTVDGDGATSAWSATCEFVLDQTRPEVPPTVHSDYFIEDGGPPGLLGPGEFTFTANGVDDVVAFRWFGDGITRGTVEADHPGGSATVSIRPTVSGLVSLSVASLDAAANRSDERIYRFWVASNAPTTSLDGQYYYYGQRVPVTLTATQEGAETFTYVFEGDPYPLDHTVPVTSDGTATVYIDIPRDGPSQHDFLVWSNVSGSQSQINTDQVVINDAAPQISASPNPVAAGAPVTITISLDSLMPPDVLYYSMRVDGESVRVPEPEADGTVQQTIVLSEPGSHTVTVYAAYTNGGFSGTSSANVLVE